MEKNYSRLIKDNKLILKTTLKNARENGPGKGEYKIYTGLNNNYRTNVPQHN